jgi:HK97 family phage prohead protease
MIRFTASAITVDSVEGEQPSRIISGLAVPYNVDAVVSDGRRVRILEGALPEDGRPPRLIMQHDADARSVVGIVTERVSTSEGMMFTAEIANTTAGNDLLELLRMGALDSVSVGLTPKTIKAEGRTDVVTSAEWDELSVVYAGAFSEAKIYKVSASEPEEETEVQETPTDNEGENVSQENPTVEASTETVPTTPLFAMAKREFKLPTAAEYISAQLAGGAVQAEFNNRLRASVDTGDLGGILPEIIVQPVYNNFIGRRPTIEALTVKAMPQGGKIFIRPKVTTHTTVGPSNGENVALDSGTFVVTELPVTKGVYGGYVQMSEESMDWSTPEVVGLILDDMSRIYANETDSVIANQLEDETTNTNNFTSADIAKPEVWAQWIFQAASDILTGSNGNLPTTLFMAPNRWASLANLSDDSGRPLFSTYGTSVNSFGSLAPNTLAGTAFGMNVCVDRNLPSGTLILGDPTGFEVFEQMKGAISVESADGALSRYLKFRGYLAGLMVDDTKFVKAAFV